MRFLIESKVNTSQLVMPGFEKKEKQDLYLIKKGVPISRYAQTNVPGTIVWLSDRDLLVKKILQIDFDGESFSHVLLEKIMSSKNENGEKPWEEPGKTYYVAESFLKKVEEGQLKDK